MRFLIGTSGYAYREWKGPFYPEKLPQREMLDYYASRLGTVEINNTFYRMPTVELVEGWAARVPESFSFVIKAPQRITHRRRLKEANEETGRFVSVVKTLGDRLGPALFQLPPYLKKDAELLRSFVALLPEGFRAAFEFRHASWQDDEVDAILRERGLATVGADTDKLDAPAPIRATGEFGYLRLRRADYDDGALTDWGRRCLEQPWEAVWVFFKHEDEGAAPRMALRFEAIVGSLQEGS